VVTGVVPRVLRLTVAVSLGTALFVATASAEEQAADWRIVPAEVSLRGNFARAQLLIQETDAAGQINDQSRDLTHSAQFRSLGPEVVTVGPQGELLAVANGTAEIEVTSGDVTRRITVAVGDVAAVPDITFSSHVRPILSKAGCNMGACHASQHGQAGFKLSVFGTHPAEDRIAIVRDRQQRRVNFNEPEQSLMLRKPTMQVGHGGGRRLTADSIDYRILLEWIRSGASAPNPKSSHVTSLEVEPKRRVADVGQMQQLRVEAVYSDGARRDVTAWTKFDSMDDALLSVDENGKVDVLARGQAPVMARFEGHAQIAMFIVPYADDIQLADWKNHNYVDELASAKFRELGIEPTAMCDDATFVRRAFLDTIGGLPTIEETETFLSSSEPDKREKLIDRLLGLTGDPAQDIYNDRYAAYWTLKWSDLIRNQSDKLGEQGMWALHNWIKEAFRSNWSFDRFVTELVTAKGSIYSNGPANYFRINGNASDLTESTAQLFMGIRLQCAKCHHHPFEKYSQDDYQSFARFFARVGTKGSQEFGLFGRESVVVVKMNKTAKPKPLGGEPVDHPLDLRIPLAKWITSPENDYFAKSVVNRYVAYLLGRGLVEPVDDLRETNPPSNVALMQALADDFTGSEYNLKHLMRTLMASRLYQLESQPTEQNASDNRFYSHYAVKRIAAEPLLDAIDQTTGVATKFKQLPSGTRAIELPDAKYPNYFLKTFGKPKRASVCECERMPDENLSQALHSLNGNTLARKIADKKGRVAKLLAAKESHDDIVDELYVSSLCRHPSEAERVACREFLEESPSPQECYEDLLWALLNSKQFLYVR